MIHTTSGLKLFCGLLLTLSLMKPAESHAQPPGPQKPTEFLAHLAAANSALRLREVDEAKRWLQEIPVAARGWEWELLHARCDSSLSVFSADGWTPIRIDLSPDGQRVVAACSDGFVRIYQAHTWTLEKQWQVSEQTLYAARFHPVENVVAVCARDGELSLWNIEQATKIWSQKSGGEGLADVVFRPDGKQLLFCSWYRGSETVLGIVSTWNAQTGEAIWKTDFGVKPIVTARYSPDGKRFAVGNWDAQIGVWSTENLGEPKILDFSDRIQYSAIDDIAFSPDSKYLASATKNGTPRVWSLDDSKPHIDLEGHANSVFSIAFSSDGRSLLSGGSDGVLSVWNIEKQTQTHRFFGHVGRISSIAVDPNSTLITTASADKTIRRWDLRQARAFESPEASKFVYGMVVADQGKALVTAGQSPTTITVWDATSREAVRHFEGIDGSINYLDSDGRDWVVGGNWGGEVVIWNLQTGSKVKSFGAKELGGIQQCTLSQDQRWVAATTNKKQAVVWNAQTGEVQKILPMPNGCWAIDFSKDCQFLYVGDSKGSVNAFKAQDWSLAWECEAAEHQINAICVAPDGKWLAAGSDVGTLAIVDIDEKRITHRLKAHSERIWTLDISPDGQRIVTGSADRKAKTWEPESGKPLLTISDFAESIYNIGFAQDGQSLYVNSLGSQLHALTTQPSQPESTKQ